MQAISKRWLAALALSGVGGIAAADQHVVVIEAMQFSPATLEVKAGDVVIWKNKDPFPHTATAGKSFDSGEIGAGRSWKFKARRKGEFQYVCTLHPTMKATLIVR